MGTPEEIADRSFLVSLRGYDRDEVRAFLRELADEVATLRERNAALEAEAAEAASGEAPATSAASPVEHFAEISQQTQRILEAAQQTADEITEAARREAEETTETARQEAEETTAAARQEAEETTETARREADRELHEARQNAARILADAERRRDATEAVVRQLEETRAGLAAQLAEVAGTIGSTLDTLASPDREGPPPTVREALEATLADRDSTDQHLDELATAGADVEGAREWTDEGRGDGTDAEAPPASEGEAATAEQAADGDEPASEEVRAGEGEEAESTPAPDGEEPDEAPRGVERTDGLAPGEDDGSPRTLRASALEPLHPQMVRRVKRGLSDVQNVVLDRVRREGVAEGVESVLPGESDAKDLGEVARPFLEQAYRAGIEAAAVLAGRELPPPDEVVHSGAADGGSRALDEGFASAAAQRIGDPLGAALRIAAGAEEPIAALNERIGSVFSELKGAAADELSATHLIRAYELGQLDAWAAGGIEHRTWVLGREPRCPEGRCRQNDQASPVEVSEPFPSGDLVPPVHVGCTCTTVPHLDEEA